MKMKKHVFMAIFSAIFLLNAAMIYALDMNYTIDTNLLDSESNAYMISRSFIKQCETSCNFSMPSISIPPSYSVSDYALRYEEQKGYSMMFYSTSGATTHDPNDLIIVEISEVQQPPEVVCNDERCDDDCVVCKDNKCHAPDFRCIEKIDVEKIFPASTKTGITQMNILVKNTGTVDLGEIYAELSGDGITTTKKIPITSLAVGDKDYTFTEINATKPGSIDLVVKLYIDEVLKQKGVGQLIVAGEEKPVEQANVTGLNTIIGELKDKYMVLEQDYQEKSLANYWLGTVYDQLKEARGYIANAQSYLLDADYAKAEANLLIAQDSLNAIELQLKSAKQKTQTFMDKVRSNILYIGSIAAALVSILAAYTMLGRTIKKHKEAGEEGIKKLKEKIKERKKAKAGESSKGKKKAARISKKELKRKKIKR